MPIQVKVRPPFVSPFTNYLAHAVEPDVGLSTMARLLYQVATATNTWSWHQALFVGTHCFLK